MNFNSRKEKVLESRSNQKSYKTAGEVEKERTPSSEKRIENVGLPNSFENSLSQSISKLKNKYDLSSKFLEDEYLELPNECRFKYRHDYQSLKENLPTDEEISSLVVFEETRIIGFGIAKYSKLNRTKIDIIDVDEFSRRSADLSTIWNYRDETFTIGVAHFMVSEFLPNLQRPIVANATNSRSRFIFKSFGFKSYSSNPCDLKLEQS
ncbi:hypothetical protein CK503_14770 [Aliifodinibius salipaludis]|uniref:N-acetyltransferase domain-containing protein n=1 Tax=Fodinibius salipaludis TaxID=2032627 RepID=A0A2A2G595_9BACT|nr:hypothetical protein [Aliifodinibius salipaludis]PAU92946.1 hypothetical protein CK503_14770 [Aliifodinibius salipaludis]